MIDWKALALAAARANAAYIEDRNAAQAAFSALGDTFIDQYKNGTHQAVLSFATQDRLQLSISGTRSLSSSARDLFDDIDLTPVSLGGGQVAKGALEGCSEMYAWALRKAPEGIRIDIQGHSLGAARTHLAAYFVSGLQRGNLYSFESPKFMDAIYYLANADQLADMVCTLNGRDPWAAWPWGVALSGHEYARPNLPHIWLNAGASIIDPAQWEGGDIFDSHDHDMAPIAAKLALLAA